MLDAKDKKKLRKEAQDRRSLFQIGKDGINEQLIIQVDDALTARELIKLRVLENAPLSAREAAEELAQKTNSEGIQVIGTRFVLYRRNQDKARYDNCL